MNKDIWNILFKEFENFNRKMDDMFDNFENLNDPNVKTYGYTMYRGPDGVAHTKEFGNPSGIIGIPTNDPVREPFTDVTQEADMVRVVVELPGADKEDIVLEATRDAVSIRVDTPKKRYKKTVALPCEVDTDTAKAEYNNGILQVIFKSVDKKKAVKRIGLD